MISQGGAAEQQPGTTLPRSIEIAMLETARASWSVRFRRLPWPPALLLLPATGLLVVFLVGPIIQAIRVATTNEALTGPHAYDYTSVGLANFTKLFSDPDFINALQVSAQYVAGSVAGISAVGLLLAYLMRRGVHAVLVKIVSGVVIVAWVVPEIVAGFI